MASNVGFRRQEIAFMVTTYGEKEAEAIWEAYWTSAPSNRHYQQNPRWDREIEGG